jgi:hypothetical protein
LLLVPGFTNKQKPPVITGGFLVFVISRKTKAAGGDQRLCFLEEKENGEKAGQRGIALP